jgi:serine protease Do
MGRQWAGVRVIRDGKTLDFKTRITKRDEKRLASFRSGEEDPPVSDGQVGLSVADLGKELRDKFDLDGTITHGVVVTAVEPGSRAAEARLREGDVILEVNRLVIRDTEGFATAMRGASKGNKILILVNREANTFFTTL